MVVEPSTQQTPVYKQEQNPREIQQENHKVETNRKREMQIIDIQGSADEDNYMILDLLFWEKL